MSLLLEKSILNQCLTVEGVSAEVLSVLKKPEVFTIGEYQKVYSAIASLNQKGLEVDMISVNNELETLFGQHPDTAKEGTLQQDWLDVLMDLDRVSNFVTGSVSHHCYLLIESAMSTGLQRVFASALHQIQAVGHDPIQIMDNVAKQFETYQGRLLELKGEPFQRVLNDVVEETIKAGEVGDAITGIRSGLAQLDNYTKGFHGSTLTIVGARPAVGKTAVVVEISYHTAVMLDIPTAVFSLEMSTRQLGRRYLARDTEYKNAQLLSGRIGSDRLDPARLIGSAQRMGNAPLYVRDDVFDLDSLKTEIKRMVRKYGVRIVFIDYIGLIDVKGNSRREEMGKASRALKRLSKDLNIPIVALAQLSREVDKREDKRPILSDLKESGDLEQDADNVLFLYRNSYYYPGSDEHELEIIVGKNRNGSTHKQGESVKFWLDLATNRIADRNPHDGWYHALPN